MLPKMFGTDYQNMGNENNTVINQSDSLERVGIILVNGWHLLWASDFSSEPTQGAIASRHCPFTPGIQGMAFDCVWITPVVKALDYTGALAVPPA